MRAIELEEPKKIRLIEIPEPDAPGAGEVLVRTHRRDELGSAHDGHHPIGDD